MNRANDTLYLITALWTIVGGTGRLLLQNQAHQPFDALPFISITLGLTAITGWLAAPILNNRNRNKPRYNRTENPER